MPQHSTCTVVWCRTRVDKKDTTCLVHQFGRLSELESRVNAIYIDTINADVSLTNTLANAHTTLDNALLVAQEEYGVAETAKKAAKETTKYAAEAVL